MKSFNNITKLLIFFPYYFFHRNYFFGIIFKIFVKKFYFKNFSFDINVDNIKVSQLSSFLFNTYEYNDRVLILKYISKKNHSIIIGGGIGFIATLAYYKSKNKVLIFEINKKIIQNLKNNLDKNNVVYDLFIKNLLAIKTNEEKNHYYETDNFLESSIYLSEGKKIFYKSITKEEIIDFNQYNTLIIDAEGSEKYYLDNISEFKSIKYVYFELHYNLISQNSIVNIFQQLKKNNFKLIDQSFNSFYFIKK